MEFLAHISEDQRIKQTLPDHLQGTAALSAAFAGAFGAAEQGYLLGTAHDIGKFSGAFQKRLFGGPKVDHATAGALECAKAQMDWAGFCIAGHHSGLPDGGNPHTDRPGDPTYFGRLKKGLVGGIPAYAENWSGTLKRIDAPKQWGKENLSDAALIRMLYSALVDADYLDTEQSMTGQNELRPDYDNLPKLWERLQSYTKPWFPPKTDLNRARCRILEACKAAGEWAKGLYTLTVPTGGGKTVASLAFALRHAILHGMQRVIYVIPYTSIIEQNAAVFRDILGERNVLEHHSGILLDMDENADPAQQRQSLAAENWDAPVIVTTAVQLFESFYANRSSKCRKLHNLANSVVIFDEAQMLPATHLRPCVAAIAQLVRDFGATAVLCTATQPSLDQLFRDYAPEIRCRELCPEPETDSELFRRTVFRNAGRLTADVLAAELTAQKQVLCIVNTRKAAQELFEKLPGDGSFHLSTLMYPAHRKQILETIRDRLKCGLPCRVVSTSLIEAGVDVDFPAVYREMAGLDSILQAAGRCNREGKHSAAESIVTIFEGETPAPPLFKINIGAAKEALAGGMDPSDPAAIRRYFSAFLSLAGDQLDKFGVIAAFEKGVSGCSMPFRTVAERFRFIDSDTKTIYIPENEGKVLIDRLRNGEHSRTIYRKAGQYGVNVYAQHFRELQNAGDIELLSEDCAVLINPELYEKMRGLSLKGDIGKAQFI